jgi:hypothetical protein
MRGQNGGLRLRQLPVPPVRRGNVAVPDLRLAGLDLLEPQLAQFRLELQPRGTG